MKHASDRQSHHSSDERPKRRWSSRLINSLQNNTNRTNEKKFDLIVSIRWKLLRHRVNDEPNYCLINGLIVWIAWNVCWYVCWLRVLHTECFCIRNSFFLYNFLIFIKHVRPSIDLVFKSQPTK